MNQTQNKKIMFVGGGSGGHLSIIKALIDYIRANPDKYGNDFLEENVFVVGGKLGMIGDSGKSIDQRWIPEFGVKYKFIRSGKLHRGIKGGGMKQIITTIKLLSGFIPGLYDSFKLINKFKPDVIIGAGGYVTLPMLIVGKLFGKKIVIHEQTLTSGLTNKIGSFLTDKILVTFEESKKYFAPDKTILTGIPVRKEIFEGELANNIKLSELCSIAKKLGRKILYVTGGSQGAHTINKFVFDNLDLLTNNFSIIWQTGDNKFHNDYEKFSESPEVKKSIVTNKMYISKFIKEEIGFVLKNSDFIICRPGINTLIELAVLNKRAIIVPLWVTAGNDQKVNAEWFVNHFIGKIISEQELSIDIFMKSINEIETTLIKPERLHFNNVEERILNEILDNN